jgi:hypothetical protein
MRRATWMKGLVLAGILVGLALPAVADVKLPAVFGRHMALQRDADIPVWGWASQSSGVRVQEEDGRARTRGVHSTEYSVPRTQR